MREDELQTERVALLLHSPEDVRAMFAAMSDADRAHVSPLWLAQIDASASADPWIHGFSIVLRADHRPVGEAGFKGPPAADGTVEIAYGVNPDHRGRGYATEAAQLLTDYALKSGQVRAVRAHTLPVHGASARVLTKCGFRLLGEVIDPEDGLVWRWEKER